MSRAALALAAAALLALPARADVEDLSAGRGFGPDGPPATFVVRFHGGTTYAPFGIVGGALSWFNEWAKLELEGGAGSTLPGLQLGFALRKLFGVGNDFLVAELAVGYNSTAKAGSATLGQQHNNWTNLGMGFEHRGANISLTVTAGLTLLSFSESPTAYLQAGVGFGF